MQNQVKIQHYIKLIKPGIPIRLLTSGCNTAIENLSRFIEVICAPLTENLPSRIKNTSHLLDIIDEININGIPDNTILVSFDIVNMFPSIDNTNGIRAVTKALESRVNKTPSTECIIDGLKLCLFNNNSVFANDNLLQTNGTATGAPNSCSYADMAVAPIDDAIFERMGSTFKELLYYGRYRDDCLALWCGTKEKLNEFFNFINSLNDDLKFTMEIGEDQLCFLDLKITLNNNILSTTVYSKPTDSHLYLHSTSCHNQSTINGIPKGVALRLRRICSTDTEYREKTTEYSNYLSLRGYNEHTVNKAFAKISSLPRDEARKKVTRDQKQNLTVFATKYNPTGPNVKDIVKNHLHIIENQTELANLFPKGSIIVAHKKEQSLSNLLLRSDPYNIKKDLTTNMEFGYRKCKKGCDSCNNYVIETSSITSFATKRTFKIRRDSTCASKNVIYVAHCKKCGKQGVGSTISWKTRLANYKSHIKNKIPSCRIVKHFIDECCDNNLQNIYFVIVDVLNNIESLKKKEIEELLLVKEKFWIGTLVTQHKGMNGSHDWNRKKRTEREKPC